MHVCWEDLYEFLLFTILCYKQLIQSVKNLSHFKIKYKLMKEYKNAVLLMKRCSDFPIISDWHCVASSWAVVLNSRQFVLFLPPFKNVLSVPSLYLIYKRIRTTVHTIFILLEKQCFMRNNFFVAWHVKIQYFNILALSCNVCMTQMASGT